MSKKNGVGKFILGAGIGAALGLLFAPKKGSELRSDLKKKMEELITKVKEVDTLELKEEFMNKVEKVKTELEDLDKEKVLKIAKKKGDDLKKSAEELVALAKEKGTPVLEGIAEDVRQKTISVVKEVLVKLEKNKE